MVMHTVGISISSYNGSTDFTSRWGYQFYLTMGISRCAIPEGQPYLPCEPGIHTSSCADFVPSIHFIDIISLSFLLSIILRKMKTATLLVLPALFWASSAATLDQLFRLKTTDPGACGAKLPVVQSWLADTIALVDSALQGLQSYQTDSSIRRNLAAWFQIRSTKANDVNKSDLGKFNTVQRE